MADHTPGPWHCNGDVWVGFDRKNGEAGGYQFCAVAHVMERTGETEANAHLIAVAPDMLQLLKDYERWQGDLILCDDCWRNRQPTPTLTQELTDRLIELQLRRNTIIAKATDTGRSDDRVTA